MASKSLSAAVFKTMYVDSDPLLGKLWGIGRSLTREDSFRFVDTNWKRTGIEIEFLDEWALFDVGNTRLGALKGACCYANYDYCAQTSEDHIKLHHHCVVCGATGHGVKGVLLKSMPGECSMLTDYRNKLTKLCAQTGAGMSDLIECFGFTRYLPSEIICPPTLVPEPATKTGQKDPSPSKSAASAWGKSQGSSTAPATESGAQSNPAASTSGASVAAAGPPAGEREGSSPLSPTDPSAFDERVRSSLGAGHKNKTLFHFSTGSSDCGLQLIWCECEGTASCCRLNKAAYRHPVFKAHYIPLYNRGTSGSVERNLRPVEAVVKKFFPDEEEKYLQELMVYQTLARLSPSPCAPLLTYGQHFRIGSLDSVPGDGVDFVYIIATARRAFTLAAFLEGTPARGPRTAVLSELVHAVALCHSNGVYHGDLKPDNILVHQNMGLKNGTYHIELCDFEGAFVSTVQSQSPEQSATQLWEMPFRPGRSFEDRDNWALGMIAYEILRDPIARPTGCASFPWLVIDHAFASGPPPPELGAWVKHVWEGRQKINIPDAFNPLAADLVLRLMGCCAEDGIPSGSCRRGDFLAIDADRGKWQLQHMSSIEASRAHVALMSFSGLFRFVNDIVQNSIQYTPRVAVGSAANPVGMERVADKVMRKALAAVAWNRSLRDPEFPPNLVSALREELTAITQCRGDVHQYVWDPAGMSLALAKLMCVVEAQRRSRTVVLTMEGDRYVFI